MQKKRRNFDVKNSSQIIRLLINVRAKHARNQSVISGGGGGFNMLTKF